MTVIPATITIHCSPTSFPSLGVDLLPCAPLDHPRGPCGASVRDAVADATTISAYVGYAIVDGEIKTDIDELRNFFQTNHPSSWNQITGSAAEIEVAT